MTWHKLGTSLFFSVWPCFSCTGEPRIWPLIWKDYLSQPAGNTFPNAAQDIVHPLSYKGTLLACVQLCPHLPSCFPDGQPPIPPPNNISYLTCSGISLCLLFSDPYFFSISCWKQESKSYSHLQRNTVISKSFSKSFQVKRSFSHVP